MKYVLPFVLPLLLAGCNTFQWRATEPIRQAADRVAKDIDAALPVAGAEATPYLAEAKENMARVVVPYIGEPDLPARTVNVITGQRQDIEQAAADAAKPPPTTGDVIAVGTNVADQPLGIAEWIAGLLGAGGLATGIRGVRKWAKTKTAAIKEQADKLEVRGLAIQELVSTIKVAIDGDKEALDKALVKQSKPTQELVAMAKVENRAKTA